MAPATRIIIAVLGTTILAIALCAVLIFGSLDRLRLGAAEANVDFMLTQLRGSLEANAGLGLPLADMRIAQDLIERAKANDEEILAVELFSPDGVSLFNTDRGSIGEKVAPLWQDAIRYRFEDERWRIEELGNIVVGEVIRNDFDEPIGYIAVTISGDARREHAETLAVGLLESAAFLTPPVLLAVLLMCMLVFRRLQSDFRVLARSLSEADGPGSPGGTLAEQARSLHNAVDLAVADLKNAAARVLAVDEADGRHE